MTFEKTNLPEVLIVRAEKHEDDRGYFVRTFCAAHFVHRGLKSFFPQESVSYNRKKGTLRGMHFQKMPHAEAKVVRVTSGAIYDVAVDIRRNSATFGCWTGTILSQENRLGLYIPEGFAHGFITLMDDVEVFYQISTPYVAKAFCGFHWKDRDVDIQWPLDPVVISERDSVLCSFEEAAQ